MKVRLLTNWRQYKPGDIADVIDVLARDMVDVGAAEYAEQFADAVPQNTAKKSGNIRRKGA